MILVKSIFIPEGDGRGEGQGVQLLQEEENKNDPGEIKRGEGL